MSPYQHIFSTNAVLGVWRNLRAHRDQNDLLLTVQYQPDDVRPQNSRRKEKGHATETSHEVTDGKTVEAQGKSIRFVVPWRSMQSQRKELLEKEKKLAEALVIRHLAAGISRQMSKLEVQMLDNAPYSTRKNLFTGGEIAGKFLPAITALFHQHPIPQRMIFELLMELKDLVFLGCVGCTEEDDEAALQEIDDALVQAITPIPIAQNPRLKRKDSKIALRTPPIQSFLARDSEELLFTLESLQTTAHALTLLPLPIPDFCAHAIISLRRIIPRQTLADFEKTKSSRDKTCAQFARCAKWARTDGGCGRGCKDEDEDQRDMPSWHRCSRWFEEGSGTCMVGGGQPGKNGSGDGVMVA
ncbi:hypothetical protein SNOG_01793 [Parastagonospora nodorum SN15]|uniref:Uncharacterized protein n=1 Tax=Phaeosphaeria nodorum (strain SN15 / ATCC MYA-4574 / FGSC 10173) TaxID=321614 RepID=Q0V2H1_PHANO|nr:hypothetical protein SNOG_01793 [Parastagonospora nodorum SN15]EAT91442.2 hypothetical protein SNOG_01793 [Parastagonospora nodorum SN15]